MTIPTLRTPKGKMIHAVKYDDGMQVTPTTAMALVHCGREFTGTAGSVESPEDITCPRCQAGVLAELAAELAEVHVQIEEHGEPTVLMSPETVREPSRRRYRSPGYRRHCKVTHERQERRRRMKETLTSV